MREKKKDWNCLQHKFPTEHKLGIFRYLLAKEKKKGSKRKRVKNQRIEKLFAGCHTGETKH